MIDFSTLKLPRSPNTFLIAPEGLCANAAPHAPAPRFRQEAAKVRAAWAKVVARQPKITPGDQSDSLMQDEWVQRTAWMSFPDTITARFIPLPEGGSTIAVYSRSKFGYRDFGVNRKRVEAWIAATKDELG
jgi:uncharacterized protein (DUF1499 family)